RILAIHQLDELPRRAEVEVARFGAAGLGDEIVEPHFRRESTRRRRSGQYHFTKLPTLVLSSVGDRLYDRSVAEIRLENVSKLFAGGVAAVDDVTLTIADGEFLVLVGPSGCGKTTLLRMIAGLEEVTDGQISIDGTDVTDLAPRRRDIAMVFQSYAL